MSTASLSLHLDSKLKSRLIREAKLEKRAVANVVRKAIVTYIENQRWKRFELRAAAIEADKGVFISSEAVDAWMESWDTDNELPPPEADIFPEKP